MLDEAELEAEQFNLPCPNLATENTYGGGGEDEVRGRHEDDVEEVAAENRTQIYIYIIYIYIHQLNIPRINPKVKSMLKTNQKCEDFATMTPK